MSSPFLPIHLEELARLIEQINAQNGGWGTISIEFQKGQIRFIALEVKKQFNLDKSEPSQPTKQ